MGNEVSELIQNGLTQEELDALTLDEGAEPEAEETAPAAEQKQEAKEEAEPEAEPAKEEAPAAKAEPEAEAEEEEPEAEANTFKAAPPPLVVEAVTDADTKLEAIAAEKDKLAERFDDGDITNTEYRRQMDALSKQERDIERAQDRARLANDLTEQAMRNAWYAQASAFASDNGYTDARRMKLLDEEVKSIANAEPSLNGAQILNKAHKNLVDAGLIQPKQDSAKPDAKQSAKKPTGEIPPSIHKVPASDVDSATGGKWAELDRLMSSDPLRYERELAKLTEAQQAEYLAE